MDGLVLRLRAAAAIYLSFLAPGELTKELRERKKRGAFTDIGKKNLWLSARHGLKRNDIAKASLPHCQKISEG